MPGGATYARGVAWKPMWQLACFGRPGKTPSSLNQPRRSMSGGGLWRTANSVTTAANAVTAAVPATALRYPWRPRALHHERPWSPARRSLTQARTYGAQRDSMLSYASKVLSDPVVETVVIASRITRILIGSALVVGGITFGAWEGMHQYVEHVSMPERSRLSRLALYNTPEDLYGFATDEALYDWTHCSRTDSRLGMYGRHIVRAAWMAQHWGSGIEPSVMLSHRSGNSATRASTPNDLPAATENQGLHMAEQFLCTALHIAENRHLAVPDEVTSDSHAPDPAAVRLELWLASIREQLGTPLAIHQAALTCEKIYDVVPDPALRTLVATRLGTQCGLLGKTQQGEEWLDRAMQLGGMHIPMRDAVQLLLSRKTNPYITPRNERTTVSILQAWSALCAHQVSRNDAKQSLHQAQAQSKEQLKEQERDSWLMQAFRAQLAALVLTETILTRVNKEPAMPMEGDKLLHKLWAEQKQGVMAVHMAETLYALQTHKKSSVWKTLGRLLHMWTSLTDAYPSQYVHSIPITSIQQGSFAQSRAWLTLACQRAARVKEQLANDRHRGDICAQSILADANELEQEASKLLRALERR